MITLEFLDRVRHKIPFWWWLTYDALVLFVILLGFFGFRTATLWLGLFVLAIAVFIDTVESIVKRPSARSKLKKVVIIGHYTPTEVTPGEGDKEYTAFIFNTQKQADEWLNGTDACWYPDTEIISTVVSV